MSDLTPEQGALEAFRDVLKARRPDLDFLAPHELPGGEPATPDARKIAGSLTAPKDDRPLPNRRIPLADRT